MPTYDTFGFASSDLEQVREALENCLGIQLVPLESSFIGNYYLHEVRPAPANPSGIVYRREGEQA